MRAHKAIPGPRGYPLLGVLPELRRDPLAAFERAARDYGDVVRLPVGPIRVFLLNHPDHVKRVVQDNHRNYRLTRFYKRLRPVFGDGVFTSEGTRWSRQRRVLQFISLAVSVSTAACETSLPVPLVVGRQTSGTTGPGTLSKPK